MARPASQTEPLVRPETSALIPVAGSAEAVLPDGDREIAELIGTSIEDLTSLPFGRDMASTMWMSQSAQIDHDAPVNKPASHALQINGLTLVIRGAVVVHHPQAEMSSPRKPGLRAKPS